MALEPRLSTIDERAESKKKVQIRGSQFMQNAFTDLVDLIGKLQKNNTVSIAEKQC